MAEDVPFSSLPPLIPFLPDDISVRCIARVPVSSHTALAHVSRSWRSFIRSPSFFSLRSEIAVTELVLTVSILTPNVQNCDSGPYQCHWYHLRPYQTPFALPPTLEQEHHIGAVSTSLGSHLFVISPNSFQTYDGCLRRWSHGPPTSTPRKFPSAGMAGGRIHVIGGCKTSPLAESLDPTGIRWDPVPPIPANLFRNGMHSSHVMDGKLLVISGEDESQLSVAAFDPDTAEWAAGPPWWVDCGFFVLWAVVGGIPYVFDDSVERILGYGNDGQWRQVEGESVTELLSHMDRVTLLNFGGLLCFVGEERELRDGLISIACAGIDISRTDDGGFRGSVMWLDSGSLWLVEGECVDQCVVLEL